MCPSLPWPGLLPLVCVLSLPAQDLSWRDVSGPEAGRPRERSFHAMACLPDTGVVLFGGGEGGASDLDVEEKSLPPNLAPGTWLWQPGGWELLQLDPQPPLRVGHSMAVDPRRNRVVLFGGAVGTVRLRSVDLTLLNDVWEFDGTGWTQIQPANRPSPRVGAAMAYDFVRETVVLYGGSTGIDLESVFTDPLGDMWEWDGLDWSPVDLSLSPDPGPRGFAAMASGGSQGEILMCGGDTTTGAGGSSDDVWSWNGLVWSNVPPAGQTSLGRRAGHTLVYDQTRELYVCAGGRGATAGSIANLQEFDPASGLWATVLPPLPVDPDLWRVPRRFSAAAFLPPTQTTLVMGGEVGPRSAPSDDNETWTLGPAERGRLQAAQLGAFGGISGCPTSAGRVAALAPGSFELPNVNGSFEVVVEDLPNDLPPVLLYGFSDALWSGLQQFLPLELGFLGMESCYLEVDPLRDQMLTVEGPGRARAAFGVPDEDALIGLEFFMQALVLDPDRAGVGGNTLGAVLSNRLSGVIGGVR